MYFFVNQIVPNKAPCEQFPKEIYFLNDAIFLSYFSISHLEVLESDAKGFAFISQKNNAGSKLKFLLL